MWPFRQTLKFLFVILLDGLHATASHAAGVREILIPAIRNEPEISARLWTPCATPSGPIIVDRQGTPLTIHGVKDCATMGMNLPLIIISHGMLEDMFSHHDTAEFLADAGFVVVTFNHTQDSSVNHERVDDISSFLIRPVDIKRVLDFMLGSQQASADIDPIRIGFFGFSRGGYTGLVLAGAIPNFHSATIPCPVDLLICKQIRQNDIPAHVSGYEPRIKAFVIADPVSFFPDKSSLQDLKAPVQLWSSERGGMGVRPEDVASLAKNLPNAPDFHRPPNSAHFSFEFPCTRQEAKTLSPMLCTDPQGFDRAHFHRRFNVQVRDFFRKYLPYRAATYGFQKGLPKSPMSPNKTMLADQLDRQAPNSWRMP